MSAVGITREEIREYVHQYNFLPHGTRTLWFELQLFPSATFYLWNRQGCEAVLDRNLVPRDYVRMDITRSQRALGTYYARVDAGCCLDTGCAEEGRRSDHDAGANER